MRTPAPPAPDRTRVPVRLDATPTPSHYEVDARGRRTDGLASTVAGADFVRYASLLDAAALLGLGVAQLWNPPDLLLGVLLLSPIVALMALDAVCVFGMQDMTLRVRRIVGWVLPAVLLARAASGNPRVEPLTAPVLIAMGTTFLAACAAHESLVLTAGARKHEIELRPASRPETVHATALDEQVACDVGGGASRSGMSWLRPVVFASGIVLSATGLIEAFRRVWWFGLIWLSAGVLLLARSQDVCAPSSERRLARMDRANPVAWLLAPLLALVGVARAYWILTKGS